MRMGKIRNGIDWPRFKAKYPNMREPCFGMAFCVTGKFPRIVRMEFRRIFLDALFSRMAVAGGWYDCSPPADGLRARHGPRMDLGPSASNRLRKSARDGLFRITACCLGQERKGHSKMERNEIRCGNCGKLLGKGTALDFEIKCPRCKAINHLRAADSPCSETPEAPSERNHARKH